ncbi:MAG: glycosyltransferase [Mariprofundaceae bacterium]|nr:glycosyltransferase [Mariprofundaceae bacterium]
MVDAVSILVITRDRREMLNRLLGDLYQQKFKGEFEIVVVEETDDPVPPPGVRYVPHPVRNRGIAYARNLSLKHADHGLLVFVDDDCRVHPDWLSKLVAPFEDQTVLGVQGGVTVPEDTNAIGWAETLLGFPGGGFTRVVQSHGEMQETREVSTLNAAYRKEAVITAGGFSDMARFGGEDFLLAKEVAKKGKLYFIPDAEVRHEARGNLASIWQWFVRRGRAEVGILKANLAPPGYGRFLLGSSLLLKLFVLLALTPWLGPWPLLLFVLFYVGRLWYRFRWFFSYDRVPAAAVWVLPVVKVCMDLASDAGRISVWPGRGVSDGK